MAKAGKTAGKVAANRDGAEAQDAKIGFTKAKKDKFRPKCRVSTMFLERLAEDDLFVANHALAMYLFAGKEPPPGFTAKSSSGRYMPLPDDWCNAGVTLGRPSSKTTVAAFGVIELECAPMCIINAFGDTLAATPWGLMRRHEIVDGVLCGTSLEMATAFLSLTLTSLDGSEQDGLFCDGSLPDGVTMDDVCMLIEVLAEDAMLESALREDPSQAARANEITTALADVTRTAVITCLANSAASVAGAVRREADWDRLLEDGDYMAEPFERAFYMCLADFPLKINITYNDFTEVFGEIFESEMSKLL